MQWFTQATVTQLTPDPSDMFFDVHESACGMRSVSLFLIDVSLMPSRHTLGADPRDLSSLNH